LSQLLDEEQQRELEQELEEERSPPVTTCQPILHEEIKQLCDMHSSMMNLKQHPIVFRRLPNAFTGATFVNDCRLSLLFHQEQSNNPSITTLRLLLPRIKQVQ
ncbi:unnamed protein product, partial [Rotaria sordida]